MAAFKSTHWSTTFSVWDNNTLTATEVLRDYQPLMKVTSCNHLHTFAFTPAADSD